MQTIRLFLDAVGLVVGSVVAAALLCALFWGAFRLVRHLACAAVAIGLLLTLALMGKLPHSEFLDIMLVFAVLGAAPLWIAGRAWRREHMQSAVCSGRLPGLVGRR